MTPKQCTLISTFSRACGVALMFIAAFFPADAILYACCGLAMYVDGVLIKRWAGGRK